MIGLARGGVESRLEQNYPWCPGPLIRKSGIFQAKENGRLEFQVVPPRHEVGI